jgi:uncharacterized membrane protein
MIDFDFLLLWLHIIGACVLFGTGSGIAFFMVMAHRTGRLELVAHTAGVVVLADTIFTATAVVLQPITGFAMAYRTGWPLTESWIVVSLALFVFTGLFWLPVVWIQLQMKRIAEQAVAAGEKTLPSGYFKLYRTWFICGFPAFIAVMAILWLMISKPTLW